MYVYVASDLTYNALAAIYTKIFGNIAPRYFGCSHDEHFQAEFVPFSALDGLPLLTMGTVSGCFRGPTTLGRPVAVPSVRSAIPQLVCDFCANVRP